MKNPLYKTAQYHLSSVSTLFERTDLYRWHLKDCLISHRTTNLRPPVNTFHAVSHMKIWRNCNHTCYWTDERYIVESIFLSFRHSQHSTSLSMESAIKVHNMWVMHYDTVRWVQWSFHLLLSLSLIYLTTSHFIQTLTTLDLSENQIGDKGAQYLRNAQQRNKLLKIEWCRCFTRV